MTTRRIAALFDFDGTLTRRDTMGPFLLWILKTNPASLWELPRLTALAVPYALGALSKESIKGAALRLWRRVGPQRRREILTEFYDYAIRPRLLPGGVARLQWHRSQGHLTVMVSASVDAYLELTAKRLGFERLICTRTELEPTPRVVGANCYGEEKVRRLRAEPWFDQVDWAASYAYSDHISDLPMLRLCGHPVAANPRPDLRRLARAEKIEILDW
jgi:HAD superfamily hydrolase (TIGR01490 family)